VQTDVELSQKVFPQPERNRPAVTARQGAVMNLNPRFKYPPAIARTLGFDVIDTGERNATIEIVTDLERHANPMGTVHGGVLCDIADAAIGTAHATGLGEGESFTSLDLQINFFRPVWNDRLRAVAKPVHIGKTVSRYVCDILNTDGKLVAQVTSTVMTLRGEKASGR
jgi:uncharacterized protein (TIGR00369 family)